MADTEQEATIDNFVVVTGASRERASFYLASAGWDLQSALSAFYDDSHEEAESEDSSTQAVLPLQGSSPVQPPTHAKGGFATLSDYHEGQGEGSDEDSEKFYAGGSEHSGQLITGPPRKKPTGQSLAKDVFDAARKQGAVNTEEEERERQQQKSVAFQGTGFRLGDSEGPSKSVPATSSSKQAEKVRHLLTFWANGFTVDDGPLRTGETAEDKLFIAAVSKGEIPQELLHAAKGGEVDINIEDKRSEPYAQRKPKLVAFSGQGHKLGSLAPEVVSQRTEPSQKPEAAPPPSVPLDPSLPTTSVQIRLADGTRLVAKFNHTHTINDIRQYINLLQPSMSTANYVLMTTFPNKELSDPTQTLATANLLNAVIVQRMK